MTNEEIGRQIQAIGLEIGRRLLAVKTKETREGFVKHIRDELGLAEIEGQAICRAMKDLPAPEAGEYISALIDKADYRREAVYDE
jgi:hypothetical protein